jgi:hypothetical protein
MLANRQEVVSTALVHTAAADQRLLNKVVPSGRLHKHLAGACFMNRANPHAT